MDPQIQRALAHPRRTEILNYLIQKGGEGTNESELADSLAVTTHKVKYHLTVLRDANLIAHTNDRAVGATECFISAASASK